MGVILAKKPYIILLSMQIEKCFWPLWQYFICMYFYYTYILSMYIVHTYYVNPHKKSKYEEMGVVVVVVALRFI